MVVSFGCMIPVSKIWSSLTVPVTRRSVVSMFFTSSTLPDFTDVTSVAGGVARLGDVELVRYRRRARSWA